MRTKKYISVVLAGVTAVGLLVGCGSANNTSSAGGGALPVQVLHRHHRVRHQRQTIQWQRRKVWKRQRAEHREQKKQLQKVERHSLFIILLQEERET